MPLVNWSYTEKDVLLYALSIGCKPEEPQYVYENAADFAALPTFGVLTLHNGGALDSISFEDLIPNFSPMNVLHGEQYLQILSPIPTAASLSTEVAIVDILDKGKSAVAILGLTSTDAQTKQKLFYNEVTVFIRGSGGFGRREPQPRNPEAVAQYPIPDREPDAVVEEAVSQEAAALYRLCGDRNPLHIDREFASMAGFERPILHGLCTFGVAGKHVLEAFANGNPSALKSIKGRMAKHVFPGETLQTEMWCQKSGTVILQVRVKERGVIALNNAAAILHPNAIIHSPKM